MSSGIRLSQEEALKRINERCLEANIEFLGFDNEENAYKNNLTKLILKCKKCGFLKKTVSYANFMKNEYKCPKCGKGHNIYTEEELSKIIKEECKIKNIEFLGFAEPFKGGYTHFNYKCKICGYVGNTLTYHNFHTKNRGCISCSRNKPYSRKDLINEAKKICKAKNMEFISFDGIFQGNKTKIKVKCLECGKIWENVTFTNFQKEDRFCPHCHKSSLEKEIETVLENKKITYNSQKTFDWLFNKEGKKLKLDFYLPQYNIGIECQGKQHFEPVDFAGKGYEWAEKQHNRIIELDFEKYKKCKENGLKLLYYGSENGCKEFLGEKIYNNENEILNKITSYGKEN